MRVRDHTATPGSRPVPVRRRGGQARLPSSQGCRLVLYTTKQHVNTRQQRNIITTQLNNINTSRPVFPLGWSCSSRGEMFFFPLANSLVRSQSAPCREVSMHLPAPEGLLRPSTYKTFTHTNEQGKYAEIEQV